MSTTHIGPSITGYRDAVAERLEAGDAFGDVESAIDEIADLSEDQKSALWLFAFSKRDLADRRPSSRVQPVR